MAHEILVHLLKNCPSRAADVLVEVLGVILREPHEDASGRGDGEVGALVEATAGLADVLDDVEPGVEEVVGHGEAVMAGVLGDAFCHAGGQRFHADGGHWRGSRSGSSAPGPRFHPFQLPSSDIGRDPCLIKIELQTKCHVV
ncbi:hypothetical protein [Sorangium sp. So ce131]|uniref:hypothetical protein n=1 Tax=Sorangium sp. So ce131 TaxID=3133282 RepID=UPI003F5F0F84